MRSITCLCAFVLAAVASSPVSAGDTRSSDKIPVTAASDEARQLYLKGRDLQEKLRATDARKLFQQAWDNDKTLAMAALGLATTSASPKDLWDAVHQAVALAPNVSEGERLQIQAVEAGAKNDVARQKAALVKLVKAYPKDERAHNALAVWHFFKQEWAPAIVEYKKATAIAPEFSAPYNHLGYCYRFLEKYDESEAAFKKYIELLPGDPNPYDSYAELLMKMGRFDESIEQYRKALTIDGNFVSSYVGLGHNQIFQGKYDAARETFAKIGAVARTVGEKRAANFWTAQAYAFEGAIDKAVAEMEKSKKIAADAKDLGALAGDHAVVAEMLLAGGRPDEALAEFKAQVDSLDKADVPAEVKEGQHRGWHYDAGRVALAKKDLAGAKVHLAEFTKLVAPAKRPVEVRAQNELAGMIALEEKKYAVAAAAFAKADQQDPRVLYYRGLALRGKGEDKQARAMLTKAADFNGFGNNYPFVRKLAKDALGKVGAQL